MDVEDCLHRPFSVDGLWRESPHGPEVFTTLLALGHDLKDLVVKGNLLLTVTVHSFNSISRKKVTGFLLVYRAVLTGVPFEIQFEF